MESPCGFQFSFSLPRVTILRLSGHSWRTEHPCRAASPAQIWCHAQLEETPPSSKKKQHKSRLGWVDGVCLSGAKRGILCWHPGHDPECVVPGKSTKRLCKTMGQVEGSAQWDKHPWFWCVSGMQEAQFPSELCPLCPGIIYSLIQLSKELKGSWTLNWARSAFIWNSKTSMANSV